MTHAPSVGILDTGAAGGLSGAKQLLQYMQQCLKPNNLGVVKLPAAGTARGVGGPADVIMTVLAPISFGNVPVILRMHVVRQEVPLLLPNSLLVQHKGILDYA